MLVTAIMPTRGRPEQSRRCLDCFLAQTWREKEIAIVDDADCPSFPKGIRGVGIYRFSLRKRSTIGAKLNFAGRMGEGQILMRFDSDDWYSPNRMADQVLTLTSNQKSVAHYKNLIFTDGINYWRNTNYPGGYGASLAYTRDWWQEHPFAHTSDGEDWLFVSEAMRANELIATDAHEMMYATIHPSNTDKKVIGAGWESCSKPDCIR
jgi:glycosyltransferase involved in cell wall biosynthesis